MKVVEGSGTRRNELAQIHMGVAALKWTDDDYRAVLFAVTGQRSSADLDGTNRKRFIAHLKACGWVGSKERGPRLTRQQWHVRMLWKELGEAGAVTDPSDTALNAFIANHVGVSSLRLLTATADASRVIEQLKAWKKRGTKGAARA